MYRLIMTKYTFKNVPTTVFFNLFTLLHFTQRPSYSNKIKDFLRYNNKLQ